MANREGSPASELRFLDEGAREVPIPFGGGAEYTCPACEQGIPTRRQIRMAKPAKYEHVLNDLFKCPFCNFIFSPKSRATVLRVGGPNAPTEPDLSPPEEGL